MPHRGFIDKDGNNVPFAAIDPIRDCARFNCSPATLAMLVRQGTDRQDLPDGITASQAGSEIRQLWLQETTDYYTTTDAAMSAFAGTMKHELINVSSEGLIVELRFVSKRNPRISGKIDHAAVVDLDDDGTLWVDLYDLKTAKWYSVTLMVKDVWKNKPDYAWQLSLCAALIEETYAESEFAEQYLVAVAHHDLMRELGYDSLRGPAIYRVKVRNLYLECIPADSSYQNEAEAKRLGVDFRKVVISVPRKSAEETYAYYEGLLAQKDAAKAAGYAPLCRNRWSNKTVQDLRCRYFCPVVDACKAVSAARGESHPLVEEAVSV